MSYVLRSCLIGLLLIGGAGAAMAQDEPEPLNVFYGEIPEAENLFFVSTTGDDAGTGTEEDPFATLPHAIGQVQRGDVIVMRGGIYAYDQTISIQSPSGFIDEMITLTAYPGEVPILDFSSQAKVRNLHGIRLNANFWHIIGITIRNASHNGIRMDGSYNILEQVTAYGNHDSGIHMAGGASHNLIKNSDSFHNFNYDTNRTPRIGNNADGFSAKFSIGPGNRYEGCRSWENSDDGFDFWEAASTIVIESSWAFGNGDETVFDEFEGEFEGNGNGFKLGGNYVRGDHIVRRSMAFDNFGSSGNAKGFDYNNNPGAMTLEHNTAYNNGRNYWFPLDPPGEGQAVFLNNLSATTSLHAGLPPSAVVAGNSWQKGQEVTEAMFLSVETDLAKLPREQDGSLPESDLLRLAPGSFLVDGGVAFGHPFYGSAPDIGAYPVMEGELVDPWVDVAGAFGIDDVRVFDIEAGDGWSVEDALTVGDEVYGDSPATLAAISESLRVDAWLLPAVATAAKNYLFTVADFTSAEATTILVAHPNAVTQKPDWLAAFEPTDASLVVMYDGTEHTLTVYAKDVAAGESVSLGRNSVNGSIDMPMYLVMAGAVTAVSAEDQPAIAGGFALHPNYPNPFHSSTTISYTLPRPSDVTIRVMDTMGREVARLADGRYGAGRHDVEWQPAGLASGVYFVRLEAEGTLHVGRMVLVR